MGRWATYGTTVEGRPYLKAHRKRDRSNGSLTGMKKLTWQSTGNES